MSESDTTNDSTPNESPNQPAVKKPNVLVRILTDPILLGLLTFIGLPISLYSFFTEKEPKPVYKVLSNVVLTDKGSTPKIKVYYDSVQVDNVRAATVAFWNAGNAFLDKAAFSKDKPITIYPYDSTNGGQRLKIRILDVKLVASTRPDLKFDLVRRNEKKLASGAGQLNDIQVLIRGDEGLEAEDGANFLVLYTNAKDCNWKVDGRIKGIPEGFVAVYKNSKSYSIKFSLLAAIGVLSIVGIRMYRRISSTSKYWVNVLVVITMVSNLVFALAVTVYVFMTDYSQSADVPAVLLP